MTNITEKIAALEAAANDTTPGPWEYRLGGDEREGVYYHDDIVFGGSFCDYIEPCIREYEYIALANPATILELIARIRALEQERDNANAAAVGVALQAETLQAERDALCARIEELEAQIKAAQEQEPVGVLFVGGEWGEELQDWEFDANQGVCDRLNEAHCHNPAALNLYTHPIPSAPAVPEGWKLVPVEPTDHMLLAVKKAQGDHGEFLIWRDFEGEDSIRDYKAMLAAAPTKEKGE